MKRPDNAKPPKKGDWGCPDAQFRESYPNIAQYLCDGFYDDGKPRERSSLKVSMDSDYVSIALNDPAEKRGLYTTAPSLTDALGMMEGILQSGKAEFRKWKFK